MFKSKEGWGLPAVSAIAETYSLECKSLDTFSCEPLLDLLSLTCWLMVLELPWALRGCAAALTACVCVVESSGHFLVLLLSFFCHIWVRCCRHKSLHQGDEVDDASVHQEKGLLLLLWQHLSAQLVLLSEELLADTCSLSCGPYSSEVVLVIPWSPGSGVVGAELLGRLCEVLCAPVCPVLHSLTATGCRKVHVTCSSARS